MHLLPHKSWNVWSAKNKEKVQKDEQEHERKIAELKRKQIESDAERRYNRLRGIKNQDTTDTPKEEQVEDVKGFSLFDEFEIESGIQRLEKRQNKEAKEKDTKPWYFQSQEELYKPTDKSERIKNDKDPMKEMNKHLHNKRKTRDKRKREAVISTKSSGSSVAEMREKRLKREREERERIKNLLKQHDSSLQK